MNEEEKKQEQAAVKFVKENWNQLKEEFASKESYPPVENPVSLFMAGAPGVGKTETSERLIAEFDQKPVRIDADEIRGRIPGYDGGNSYIFQKACTIIVNHLYGHVLKRSMNMVLDGTFAYAGSLDNVKRSLKKDRKTVIYFLYQEPEMSWEFTKKREAVEHRKVLKDVFIEAYFKSKENVDQVKKHFGNDIELNLIIKNFEARLEKLEIGINKVDDYLDWVYTREELEEKLDD